MKIHMWKPLILPSAIALIALLSLAAVPLASAAPVTITAYKSTIAVNVNGTYQPSQWTDTPMISEPTSGMTFAVKQNGTGWLFLMQWTQSAGTCTDNFCYGGIELGPLSNTGAMGSASTPTIMILGAQAFQTMVGHAVDEFISTGTQTPTSVESDGYATQSVCGALTLSGPTYTVQCYRPFTLKNASPYDFPTLGVGSTIQIGFAVGEYNNPGTHDATSMSQYVLTFSGSTYSSSSTTTSSGSSSSTTSTTSSTSTTKSTTTTTSSSPTTTTTTTSTTASTTSTKTSTTTTTTSSSTSTPTTTTATTTSSKPASTTTTTTTTPPKPAYVVTVSTSANSYSGSTGGTITGSVSGHSSPGGTVEITITNPSNVAVFAEVIVFPGNGTFSGSFTPGSGWTAVGTYTVTATYCPDVYTPAATYFTATSTFSYSSPVATSSSTSVSTSAAPTVSTTTITQTSYATSTLTTLTSPVISTVTSTTTTITNSVPDWSYGVMILLLAIGLAVGYIAAGPRTRKTV